MSIHFGSTKIKDTGDSGVYVDRRKIKYIYKGSQLVYSYDSYHPDEEVVSITNGATTTIELKPGVYQIYMAGGGGRKTDGYIPNAGIYSYAGGSGAAIEGQFFNSHAQTFICNSGAFQNPSKISLNGIDIFVAESGGNSTGNGVGGGGTATMNITGITDISLTKINGLDGSSQWGGYNAVGGASVSAKKWGNGERAQEGTYLYGGIIIQYIRRWV